ncbi:MAG: efflux RND transporter periplasmic adaptor subunit [Parachlamydiales bacterium]
MKRWQGVLVIGVVVLGIAVAAVIVTVAPREKREEVHSSSHGAITATGIVEAGPNQSNVGSNVSGVVTDVYVKVGDKVARGQPLFKLDDRDAKAQLQLARTDLEVAKKRVAEAKEEVADRTDQYERVERITDKRAVSLDEVNKRRFAKQLAEARLDTAMAEEMRARARLKVAETNLDLLTMRAPLEGQVLVVNVDAGEFAAAGEGGEPLVVVGGDQYQVKVAVNENDVWRFNPKAKASAALKGNPSIRFPLQFLYVQPYVVPNEEGRKGERVLQVVYGFDPSGLPVYIGQRVDVKIEAS